MARAKQSKAGTKTRAKRDRNAAIRERLLSQRQEILDLYKHDLRVGQEASDEASEDLVDRANNAYQREFMFKLSVGERQPAAAGRGRARAAGSGRVRRLRPLPRADRCQAAEGGPLGSLLRRLPGERGARLSGVRR